MSRPQLAPKKSIWFKNQWGDWELSPLEPTPKNLEKVKKTVAVNGQAGIFNK